ncbi:hypothetical protein SUGI_0538540 [Cryptomeria japonica]|nr:hypothetical protein SUGI_0538540 [Cryptomeria japonica]
MDVHALQVVNHGIPHSLIDTVKRIGKQFFQLPLEKKQRYSLRTGDLQGYGQAFVLSENQKLLILRFTEEISPAPELIDDNNPCLFKKFIHQDYMQDYHTRGTKGKSSFYEFASI